MNRRITKSNHSLIFRIALTFIFVVFFLIIAWYVVVGTLFVQVLNNPTGIGESLGGWIGDLIKGFESARQ